jgi:hypothetical protein
MDKTFNLIGTLCNQQNSKDHIWLYRLPLWLGWSIFVERMTRNMDVSLLRHQKLKIFTFNLKSRPFSQLFLNNDCN